MAIKIFCNACQNFIRNAKANEIGSLTGNEICEECSGNIKTAFDDVEKIARRGIVRLERTRDDIKAKLEEAVRNVIREE